uniref:Uncharacterized protein n=1 Tax=Pararge aegeria TaxID=116150 RepID=S4P8Q0_9NEOP
MTGDIQNVNENRNNTSQALEVHYVLSLRLICETKIVFWVNHSQFLLKELSDRRQTNRPTARQTAKYATNDKMLFI